MVCLHRNMSELFNINFDIDSKAILSYISWWIKNFDNIRMHGMTVKIIECLFRLCVVQLSVFLHICCTVLCYLTQFHKCVIVLKFASNACYFELQWNLGTFL